MVLTAELYLQTPNLVFRIIPPLKIIIINKPYKLLLLASEDISTPLFIPEKNNEMPVIISQVFNETTLPLFGSLLYN